MSAAWQPERLAAELDRLSAGRALKIMEVCGGHTHTIYKHGVQDLLPAHIELVHGPGCPVRVIPMGRIDDALSMARTDGVIFATFGDMLRVPGGTGSLLEAQAEGADVRIVYSPLDALKLARSHPERRVVFFAVGFETTTPATAVTLLRARAEGLRNFAVFCNHVTIIPALQAILDSPDLQLDGFVGPGHVSTIIGLRPYTFIARDYGKPLVVAGFEPLDVLQAVYMIVQQLSAWRTEVENQYRRVVRPDGNVKALELMAQVFEPRASFEWRGLGCIPASALQLRQDLAAFDAELLYEIPRQRVADHRACQCGEVLKGALKPWECRVFGTACTPETPIGTCMVSSEGACAAYYHYGRLARRAHASGREGSGVREPPGSSEEQVLARIEHLRRQPKLNESIITLAHGSGGKATHALIEAVFLEAFHNPLLARLDDQAVFALDGAPGVRLAFTTDSFVVTPIVFPGGDIGRLAVNGTVNDLAMAGAQPLYLSAGFILEEGFALAELRQIARSMSAAAAEAGVAIVTGDTKVVQRGHADRLFINTAGIGLVRQAVEISASRARPGDQILLSGPIAEHGMAIMLARGELDLEADIASDTAPLHSLVAAMLAVTSETHCLKDPTRGGVATILNEIARQSEVAVVLDEATIPVRDEVRGACELLGIDPLYVANEGKLVAVVAAEAAADVLAAMRRHPYGAHATIIGEVRADPQGLVLMRTAFGGTRIVDMLIGDPLPRIC